MGWRIKKILLFRIKKNEFFLGLDQKKSSRGIKKILYCNLFGFSYIWPYTCPCFWVFLCVFCSPCSFRFTASLALDVLGSNKFFNSPWVGIKKILYGGSKKFYIVTCLDYIWSHACSLLLGLSLSFLLSLFLLFSLPLSLTLFWDQQNSLTLLGNVNEFQWISKIFNGFQWFSTTFNDSQKKILNSHWL